MSIGFALFALLTIGVMAIVVWQPALFNLGKPAGFRSPVWYNRLLALSIIALMIFVFIQHLTA